MRQPIALRVLPASTVAERARDNSRPVMLVGFQHQGNLGLGYLAAVLRQYGYSVHVVDIEQPPEEILRIAKEINPVLIGFSLIFQFFIAHHAALLYVLREHGVNCHFTMGGHFPSLSYQQTLELVPELDSVVRFEGEMTLLELADAISTGCDWHGIQGIAYRGGEEITMTPSRALIEDLDSLPYPDRNYLPDTVLGRSIMPLIASRGCARTCSFCSIHTFYRAAPGKIVRTRKPAEVVREMRMLHEERGITIFLFQDDDFPLFGTVWRRWANDFVDELHRSGLPGKVIWKMNCRADAVDRDLFIRMRDAGLYLVYMGLESGSEQGLETLHKQITVAQNLRAVKILKSIGLMWEYGFMLLDPSSTFESVRDNLKFLRTILADGCLPVTFCRMLPYDGTPIKDELVRTGRLKGDVCNPDYDFLDPRLTDFYEGLTNMISLRGWIHGLEAVTVQLSTAWHEVAVMQRLFPKLPGMRQYKMKLSAITKRSNSLLLDVVEDLTYVYSDRREIKWKPEEVEASRQQVLDDLIAQRDEFVLANEELLLATLQREGVPIPTATAASAVMPA
ncbi:MAG TPA: B12-binding domain-containing radical SAM protein [Blastocatellia bacterium]|nr:B12-binding domain-containing radical SAM protein [Blastocatellia bacterium]